ncbi:MAG: hypothetical protein K0S77_3011, partial [Pseudomonas sp.]|nr:hypothetical protein [Pseudomonas sp.]
ATEYYQDTFSKGIFTWPHSAFASTVPRGV